MSSYLLGKVTEQNYRPDVDGLRALAVLVVIFHHVGFTGFNGGFIGVDIFFVISGYLITRNIASEVQKGIFHFPVFIYAGLDVYCPRYFSP
jgi:peptidoglycan/LPS O-acetylase OafA/YrhL